MSKRKPLSVHPRQYRRLLAREARRAADADPYTVDLYGGASLRVRAPDAAEAVRLAERRTGRQAWWLTGPDGPGGPVWP